MLPNEVMRAAILFFASVVVLSGSAAHALTTNLVPVADTSVHASFPDNNFGGGTSFTSGHGNIGTTATRALLRFDIASRIPAGATINGATLTLTVINVNGPDSTFMLHRLLASWGEGNGSDRSIGSPATPGEATWNNRLAPSTAWATPGGDFVLTASASQAVVGFGAQSFSSDGLAADMQLWLDNPGTNFGWLLLSDAEAVSGTIRRFAGRLDPNTPPQLVVDYTPAASPATPPVLTNLVRIGDEFIFSFDAESNRTYVVEFRDSLTAGDWSAMTTNPAQPAAATLHVTNVISSDQRLFRVRTP